MDIPIVTITVECNGESETYKIKGEAKLSRYRQIFKSILKFNGYQDDIINKHYDYKI